MTHLCEVFSRLRAGNLVLKASKCHLAKKSIHYLGFIIEPGIMKIDLERLHAVTDFPQPTNLKEFRRYLIIIIIIIRLLFSILTNRKMVTYTQNKIQ